MPAFTKVLFIDDDFITINICERMMRLIQFGDEFVSCRDGLQGKEYLISNTSKLPDIIFVDLHMTVMNGWEFLAKYNELEKEHKHKIVMVMLTTSLDPNDEAKAKNIAGVTVFKHKPLTEHMVEEILQKYFPRHLCTAGGHQ